MNQHPTEAILNDLVDGLLSETESRELGRHLAACPECRSAAEELRSILDRARGLPRLRPSRDLMPGIRAELARGGGGFRRFLAAAAMLVVGLLALAVFTLRDDPAPAPDASAHDLQAELTEAEQAFRQAAEALLLTLEKQRDGLPPEAAAAIASDLEALDRAIDGVRARVLADPADLDEGRVLTALQHQRIRLLWRVARLSSTGRT